MTPNSEYRVSVGAVTFGTSRYSDREFRKLLKETTDKLREAAQSDASAADTLLETCLNAAGSDHNKIVRVLDLRYLPKSDATIDVYLNAVLSISDQYPSRASNFIPFAYRNGRISAAREISLSIVRSTDNAKVLSQTTSYALIHDKSEEYQISILSDINTRFPNRVGSLHLQAELANRKQKNEIIPDIPPISKCLIRHFETLRPIVFLDGGATESELAQQFSGWPSDAWKVFGFDPHPDAKLSDSETGNVQMIRAGLGSRRGSVSLNQTSVAGASSVFQPNLDYLAHLLHGVSTPLGDAMSVVSVGEIDVIDLDTWRQENRAPDFDFIKLNVQGAELAILEGARQTLDACSGVQCEVPFSPIYKDAPRFRDIDESLEDFGFTFFDMRKPTTNGRRTNRPTVFSGSRVGLFRWPSRQLTEAHVLYLRDPFIPGERDNPRWRIPECWLRLAVVAELNGQVEFSMQLAEEYLNRFSRSDPGKHATVSEGLDAASKFYQELDWKNR